MQQNIQYWQSKEQFDNPQAFVEQNNTEFSNGGIIQELTDENLSNSQSTRRDFLKLMGFSIGAATLAASCEIPVKKAIPYAIKPEEIVPGIANYYASTYVNGGEACSVIVKTREGRPIKIEGNKASSVTRGGTSARVQASILSLYDNNRTQSPEIDGKKVDWSSLDNTITNKLNTLGASANIAIVSNSINSPTTKGVIEAFKTKFTNTRHIQYDGISYSGLLDACQSAFGKRALPSYNFADANIIVSFDADFLGTWISPIEYASDYAKNRKPSMDKQTMSRHYQIESGMSLTGSNADERIQIKPSEQANYVKALYSAVTGVGSAGNAKLDAIAKDLLSNKGESLVVCGSNDASVQSTVLAINNALGNVGSTVQTSRMSLQYVGDDKALNALADDMNAGKVDAVIVYNCNPVYDSYVGGKFANGLKKVNVSVAFNSHKDETASLCKYLAPDNHYLESWGDAEIKEGVYSVIQPVIQPVFNTRQAQASLLTWMNHPVLADSKRIKSAEDSVKTTTATLSRESTDIYYLALKNNWDKMAGTSWNALLSNGVFEIASGGSKSYSGAGILSGGSSNGGGVELFAYEKVNMGDGRFQTNPWLQEMPDPVTRSTWDNYFTLNIHEAEEKGLKMGDVIEISANGKKAKLPVMPVWGQAKGTVGIAYGYGRKKGVVKGYGDNGVSAIELVGNNGFVSNISFAKTGECYTLACVQDHHTLHIEHDPKKAKKTGFAYLKSEDAADLADKAALKERTVIREFNLKGYKESSEKLQDKIKEMKELNTEGTIYKQIDYSQGNHWGMAVDLSACTGCGACTVACMSENNVPVVGKNEINRKHEMTWIRIDRYFYGNPENPKTVYQPMMCQHCNNAPCENVCPVNATNHSAEGLNQMAYNRCIGTRYCANNCPYKVRRFNWLDYTTADVWGKGNDMDVANMADSLTRMVLNPDVTVRSRGVIEKCTFCVQRIQAGKLEAKKQGRKIKDGDIVTACASACPTGAITFGNLNDKKSAVHSLTNSERSYRVLEEFYTESNVTYLAKIHNGLNTENA